MASQAGNVYSPIIDVAVGPFAETRQHGPDFDALLDASRGFILDLIRAHRQNVGAATDSTEDGNFDVLRQRNWNARCLLAIEIENRVSRKHLMGGAINAAALGRVGLAVAWSDENLRAFVRLERYLNFLQERGKPTFPASNLIILTKDQLTRAVTSAIGNARTANLRDAQAIRPEPV